MANYTKTTDFAAKDTLPSGDSQKIIRGTEFDAEFNNIATAIASKADTGSSIETTADLVTYSPDGADAVDTTVENKLRESISVKDFGAKGDGTTDDTTAIQNAINHASCNKIQTIHFPKGHYIYSTLRLYHDPTTNPNFQGFLSYTGDNNNSTFAYTWDVPTGGKELTVELRDEFNETPTADGTTTAYNVPYIDNTSYLGDSPTFPSNVVENTANIRRPVVKVTLSKTHSGDNSTTQFAGPYAKEAEDITVKVGGSTVTNYALSQLDNTAGVLVTFTTAPATGTDNIEISVVQQSGEGYTATNVGNANGATITFNTAPDTDTAIVINHARVTVRQVLNTEYTVLGTEQPTGGTVQFVTSPAQGRTVRVFGRNRDGRFQFTGSGRLSINDLKFYDGSEYETKRTYGSLLEATGDGLILEPTGTFSETDARNFIGKDLNFIANNTGYIITSESCPGLAFFNCGFKQINTAGSGLRVRNSWFFTLKDSYIFGPNKETATGDGIDGATGLFAGLWNINDSLIDSWKNGVRWTGGTFVNTSIRNTAIQNCNQYHIFAEKGKWQQLLLDNAYFENIGITSPSSLKIGRGEYFTATASQTVFTWTFDSPSATSSIQVYKNGTKLKGTSNVSPDFSVDLVAKTVTLNVGATADDEIKITVDSANVRQLTMTNCFQYGPGIDRPMIDAVGLDTVSIDGTYVFRCRQTYLNIDSIENLSQVPGEIKNCVIVTDPAGGETFSNSTTATSGQTIFTYDFSRNPQSSNELLVREDQDFTGDGSTTVFTYEFSDDPTTSDDKKLEVYVDDDLVSSTRYTLDATAKTVTFNTAPANGDSVKLRVFLDPSAYTVARDADITLGGTVTLNTGAQTGNIIRISFPQYLLTGKIPNAFNMVYTGHDKGFYNRNQNFRLFDPDKTFLRAYTGYKGETGLSRFSFGDTSIETVTSSPYNIGGVEESKTYYDLEHSISGGLAVYLPNTVEINDGRLIIVKNNAGSSGSFPNIIVYNNSEQPGPNVVQLAFLRPGETGLFVFDGQHTNRFNLVSKISESFDLVEDTTPQLGGDLDLNGNDITGTGGINIDGSVVSESASVISDATNATFRVNASGGNSLTSSVYQRAKSSNGSNAETEIIVTGSGGESIGSWDFKADTSAGALSSVMSFDNNGDVTFSGSATIDGITYPTTDGTSGQVITTDGAGNLSFANAGGGFDPNVDQVVIGNGAAGNANPIFSSVAVGHDATASGTYAVGLGNQALATGADSVALGNDAHATGAQSVALGDDSVSGSNATIAIGNLANSSSAYGVAIGYNAQTSGAGNHYGVAIGRDAGAMAANTIHISSAATTTNRPTVAGNMVIETDDARLQYKNSTWGFYGGDVEIDNGSILVNEQSGGTDHQGIYLKDANQSNASPVIRVQGQRNDANISQVFAGGVLINKLRGDAAVASGQHIGTVYFGGNHTDGTEDNVAVAASISGVASGAFNSLSDMPTDLVFYTGSQGRAYPTANTTSGSEAIRIRSGGGITFNGDTAAANALDDYEEGTFTPTFVGSTTNGSFDYGTPDGQQHGHYTKVGNVVTCHIRLAINSVTTSATGLSVFISGLPFTSKNTSNFIQSGAISFATGWGSDDTPDGFRLGANSTTGILAKRGTTSSQSALSGQINADNLVTDTQIICTITYIAE